MERQPVDEPIAMRRADVRDAAMVARHRAAMFRDMGGSL
jgi:hypothetical protein